MPYANTSGALATAGGIVVTALIDGTVVALDDQTLEELWSINVGTGINAPPMTYAVDGKQYIAIATGLTAQSDGPRRDHAGVEEPRQGRDDDLRVRTLDPVLPDQANSHRENTAMKLDKFCRVTSAALLACCGICLARRRRTPPTLRSIGCCIPSRRTG